MQCRLEEKQRPHQCSPPAKPRYVPELPPCLWASASRKQRSHLTELLRSLISPSWDGHSWLIHHRPNKTDTPDERNARDTSSKVSHARSHRRVSPSQTPKPACKVTSRHRTSDCRTPRDSQKRKNEQITKCDRCGQRLGLNHNLADEQKIQISISRKTILPGHNHIASKCTFALSEVQLERT